MTKQKITQAEAMELKKVIDPLEIIRRYEIMENLGEDRSQEEVVKNSKPSKDLGKQQNQEDFSHIRPFEEPVQNLIEKGVVVESKKISNNKFSTKRIVFFLVTVVCIVNTFNNSHIGNLRFDTKSLHGWIANSVVLLLILALILLVIPKSQKK